METVVKYFEGERFQCTLGIVISLLFIGASIYFLYLNKQPFKSGAFTIMPLSGFLLLICIGVVLRTPRDVERISNFVQSDTEKIQSEELPRMEKVMRAFDIIKKVELGLVAIGLILGIFFWRNEMIKGIALALIIQGLVLYLFDHFAEARGKMYMEFLHSFKP